MLLDGFPLSQGFRGPGEEPTFCVGQHSAPWSAALMHDVDAGSVGAVGVFNGFLWPESRSQELVRVYPVGAWIVGLGNDDFYRDMPINPLGNIEY